MAERLHGESEKLKDPLRLEVDAHFQRKNWQRSSCENCSKQFYSKKEVSTCGCFECVQGHEFLTFSKKKGYLSIENLSVATSQFFEDHGFRRVEPRPLINDKSETLFVGAGVQLLDKEIFDEEETGSERPLFVMQPVIRTQYIDQAGEVEGVSTSFVNICTEAVNPSMAEHLSYFENWLDYLSSLGLFVNDMTLSLEENTTDWGKGEFKRLVINCNYGGLQLGDAGYFYDIPQTTRDKLVVSDIGFGLERIAWSLNKSGSYFDVLSPHTYVFQGKLGLIDATRTMVLMAAFGVEPNVKGIGQKLRMFSKRSVDFRLGSNIEHLVEWHYRYWESFIKLEEPLGRVQTVLLEERNRNMNMVLAQKLGLRNVGSKENVDVFISNLISSGISIEEIRSLF